MENGTTEGKLREYLKRVTADLSQTRRRFRAMEAAAQEPIAVVAMACRLPGGLDSPESLWGLFESGGDVLSPFPEDRGWNLDTLFHSDPENRGTTYVREASFIENAAEFDAAFFGITPREALAMDPQQRVMLEISWEVIERAGIDPRSLVGADIGVFTGVVGTDYVARLREIPEAIEGYAMTGAMTSVVSGRVSYVLGLEGPAVSIETACSSSLVALHLAMQELRVGGCGMALVGGVSILASPAAFTEFSRQRGLAEDGRIKPFAAGANGTNWGEGAGVLLVERFSDARRNGHPVLAVLRGSAINQDGASNGLTAPSDRAQERVIKAALANARLTPMDVDAVEAHGTGTRLGDPIEAKALLAVYGSGRPADQPLLLGSGKSNLGHTGAAAGVIGVIKMVMAMRHGVLPKTLNIDEPTPYVDWSDGGVELLTEPRPWPVNGHPRRAGISSFGVSGTNAHIIVEEAASSEEGVPGLEGSPPGLAADVVPLVISGKSEAALHANAARLAAFVVDRPEVRLQDIGYALTSTRSEWEHRSVLLADRATLTDSGAGAVTISGTAVADPGRVVFVFPGQGSQWWGMAAELLDVSPVFASQVGECDAALQPYLGYSVLDVIRARGDRDLLEDVVAVQCSLWAVMVSLAALWRSVGVEPAAVVGHSQGEIAAAVVCGALSLADGAKITALRATAIGQGLSGRGGMVALSLRPQQAAAVIEQWADRLSVAALNGPALTVVSGDLTALDELLAACERDGVRARRVAIDYASHSAQVDSIRDRVLMDLQGIEPRTSRIPFYSTVTGQPIDTDQLGPEYWAQNLRNPVLFDEVLRSLLVDGYQFFIEASAHPVLTTGMEERFEESGVDAYAVGTLQRNLGGAGKFLSSLAEVYVRGLPGVDWSAVFGEGPHKQVELPTYAFQRERYWLTEEGDIAQGLGAVTRGAAMVPSTPQSIEPEPLRGRVGTMREPERIGFLTTLVRRYIAEALGYPGAEAIGPDQRLASLGFDSLTAAALRSRLSKATELRLPSTLAFDHPTAVGIAAFLSRQLESASPISGSGGGGGGLHTLFLRACSEGRLSEVDQLMAGLAGFRAAFTGTSDLAEVPRLVPLSEGPTEPALICFPSFVWQQNLHYYDRMATGFQESRRMSMLALPGFQNGEQLPASLDALVEVLAEAVLQAAKGKPFALLGHSAGGSLASVVAAQLERAGAAPEALVLLDTPTWGDSSTSTPEWASAVYGTLLGQTRRLDDSGDSEAWITARARYAGFDYSVPQVRARTLLVRASEPIPGLKAGTDDWQVTWHLDHTVADSAGDHFTMLDAGSAAKCAQIVDDWLRDD